MSLKVVQSAEARHPNTEAVAVSHARSLAVRVSPTPPVREVDATAIGKVISGCLLLKVVQSLAERKPLCPAVDVGSENTPVLLSYESGGYATEREVVVILAFHVAAEEM